MKLTKSFKILAASVLCVLALSSVSYADTVYGDGILSVASPTAHATGQSTSGSGMQYYDVYAFTVDTSGSYTFELASINSVGTPSNALDTWLGIFANTFNPPALGAPAILERRLHRHPDRASWPLQWHGIDGHLNRVHGRSTGFAVAQHCSDRRHPIFPLYERLSRHDVRLHQLGRSTHRPLLLRRHRSWGDLDRAGTDDGRASWPRRTGSWRARLPETESSVNNEQVFLPEARAK